jgi:hypothetical protein
MLQLESRGHSDGRQASRRTRGDCGAARQSRTGRGGAQAIGSFFAIAVRRWFLKTWRTVTNVSRTPTWRSRRIRSWCSRTAALGAIRGWQKFGNMALPPKILQKAIKDMVRISDARISSTAYGTVILHVAPEAAVGGPLAPVHNGDMIEVDVEARKIHLEISQEELTARRSEWNKPEPGIKAGYQRPYVDRVMQANKGADFDFLVGRRDAAVPRESH